MVNNTSSALPFKPTMLQFQDLARNKKIIGLYGVIALSTGLRIGDLLRLKYSDLRGKDEYNLIEEKTNKRKTLSINNQIKTALTYFEDKDGLIFVSNKGLVKTGKRVGQGISSQQVNRLLKGIFEDQYPNRNISSHSLRKSFGKQVYSINNKTEDSLILLSEIFNHASVSVTRKYIGITSQQIKNVYLNLMQ